MSKLYWFTAGGYEKIIISLIKKRNKLFVIYKLVGFITHLHVLVENAYLSQYKWV